MSALSTNIEQLLSTAYTKRLQNEPDETAESVLADWLEEHGFLGRSAMLRSSIAIDRKVAMSLMLELQQTLASGGFRQGASGLEAYVASGSGFGQRRVRPMPLGFPVLELGPYVRGTVSTQPELVFRGHRLLIPSNEGIHLLVENVLVGKNSQFAGMHPVPGLAFSETARGFDMRLDTAQLSQLITLRLQNISDKSIQVHAMIFGLVVEP